MAKKTTKKITKTTTTKRVLPFSRKAKKGYVTVHALVGINLSGETGVYHPRDRETMEDAIRELQTYFDFVDDHFDVHHTVTVLPLPKAPPRTRAKAKKVATGVKAPEGRMASSGISHATNPGAA